jgi:hypothetical protein
MRALVVLIPFLLIGCPNQPPEPPRPVPFADDDPSWCKAGCDNLRSLPGQDGEPGCLESRPLIREQLCQIHAECEVGQCILAHCQESCEDFCKVTIENGRFLGPKCWSTIKSCEEIETVCRR